MTDSESMVERVALALEPKCKAFGKGDMPLQVAREFARAAIEAMWEPTVEMQRAGFGSLGQDCDCDQVDCWQAMISEALK